LADSIGTVPRGKRPRFGRLHYRKGGWHEKTNVGVDDVFDVNSSTFIGPKFGLKSEILAYIDGRGTPGAKSGGQKVQFLSIISIFDLEMTFKVTSGQTGSMIFRLPRVDIPILCLTSVTLGRQIRALPS
jgi:hypothetical protein